MFLDCILDDCIIVLFWFSVKYLLCYGRLDRNMGYGVWCSVWNDVQFYLEIDVEIEYMIIGIIIQGKYWLFFDKFGFVWVIEFFLFFIVNWKNWIFVIDVKSS